MNSRLRNLLVLAIALIGWNLQAEPAHTFSIGENDFLLDGKRLQIRCGEMHFARVPREYWQHRLKMCKAMGLNAVCAYLFWNAHEFEQGKYNWAGQADAAEFCKMAQAEGLWVILRPGPYACAEWDGGGLPWWLLKNNTIQLRTSDPAYVNAARTWLKEVGRVLGPQQITHGGSILMVQVENEYGSYGKDAGYMAQMRQALLDGGFDVPLFACNPRGDLRNGLLTNLFQVVNFGNDPEGGFKALRQLQPSGPLMCGEFYPGWFDTWGAPHHLGDAKRDLADLEYMLSHNASFSIYMAHGGTTFGMNSGTDRPFKPDTSSYDYDAPISEAGWATDKYLALREKFKEFTKVTPPEIPAQLPVIAIPEIKLDKAVAIDALLEKITPVNNDRPLTFEALNQGHGYVLYRRHFVQPLSGTLNLTGLRDFALVYVNGDKAGELNRYYKNYTMPIDIPFNANLEIFVENMGRINYGSEIIHNLKGIISPVRIDSTEVTGNWEMFGLPMDKAPDLSNLKDKYLPGRPTLYSGTFDLKVTGDTFLDLRKWGKGIVFVNGHHLGRYWSAGPQQTLFLPGCWLKKGINRVVIFEQKPEARMQSLSSIKTPILEELKK